MQVNDIFEYAMKMEMDGRQFYLDQAKKTDQRQFQHIWEQLADDEMKHYNLFKAIRDGQAADYNEGTRTTILSSAKNVFEELSASGVDYSFAKGVEKAWMEAREIELKTEQFYRAKAKEVDTETRRNILTRIADEEHKHYVALDNVIQFLNRPKQWLEDAEWHHLDEY